MIMRILATIYLLVHGLIHLLGVAFGWQLLKLEDLPYDTRILFGRIDIGDIGMRVFGALWLVATIGFVVAAVGLVTEQDWYQSVLVPVTLLSLGLCIAGLKDTVVGILANVIVLIAVFAG